MKKRVFRFLFLLAINLGALVLGSYLMNNGPTSLWYTNLNKAPWTPPGWVFGVAWTTIMICFSVYIEKLFYPYASQKAVLLYTLQLLLNISWNYVFFNQHLTIVGLMMILLLTVLLFYFFYSFPQVGKRKYFLLPYIIWLCLATSLNLYVVLYN